MISKQVLSRKSQLEELYVDNQELERKRREVISISRYLLGIVLFLISIFNLKRFLLDSKNIFVCCAG